MTFYLLRSFTLAIVTCQLSHWALHTRQYLRSRLVDQLKYQKIAIIDPIGQAGSLFEIKEARASLPQLTNCSDSTLITFGDPEPVLRGSISAYSGLSFGS